MFIFFSYNHSKPLRCLGFKGLCHPLRFSVEGIFQNGVVQLNQPVTGRDGQKVLIVFLPAENESPIADSAWSDFAQLLQESQVKTGIHDFAHQHDHYLHGAPKREDLAE